MLHREHLFNKNSFKLFLKNEKVSIFFLCILIVSLLLGWYFIFIYFIVIFIKNSIRIRFKFVFLTTIYEIIKGILFWIGFLFFYPKNISIEDIKYKKINGADY